MYLYIYKFVRGYGYYRRPGHGGTRLARSSGRLERDHGRRERGGGLLGRASAAATRNYAAVATATRN